MFEILRKSLSTGVVTTPYPAGPPIDISPRARGRPEIDWANWQDARLAARACPTGAISYQDTAGQRIAKLDLALCTYCGLCAEADRAIRMTHQCECAARTREELAFRATYQLKADGSHQRLSAAPARGTSAPGQLTPAAQHSLERVGEQIKDRVEEIFGRSLHIREVDAGSCNGCEVEIVGLTSPIYDLERFGIHFVASPRHADLLLVTGPVTRNMEEPLRQTYQAMPAPRLVAAVGACGCSGGIFGKNYATVGAVDAVVPVDVYIPGCPPNPIALLHGILTAIRRINDT